MGNNLKKEFIHTREPFNPFELLVYRNFSVYSNKKNVNNKSEVD